MYMTTTIIIYDIPKITYDKYYQFICFNYTILQAHILCLWQQKSDLTVAFHI